MLRSLEVKDYALIEHISIEFGSGLNIITGETGAGKSILVDAMSLLLGERASTEVVRKGAQKSVVEGIFDVKGNKKVKSLLEENDVDFTDEMIIRREISLKGTNRCFINDTPVNLNLIKEAGDLLVDLHGQHEHQSLLRTETHIDYLDEFGSYDDILKKYKAKYDELSSAEKELKSLRDREEIIKEKREIYSFQVKEIDNISPVEDEEEKLAAELIILENSETLNELTTELYDIIYESENSVQDSIVKIKNHLAKLAEIDKTFQESLNESETVLAIINDISSFIRNYKSKVEHNPAYIDGLRERLGSINLLKKKYGGSVKTVLAHRKKIGEELELAENFEEKINELEKGLNSKRKEAGLIAKSISEKRKETASKIKKGIEASLNELGIEKPVFKTEIINEPAEKNNCVFADGKPFRFDSNGIDEVQFYISTNPGEDPKPLAKVASGGEVSRIMLSLKSVLAKSDKLPLLIFDEIDVGISGRIAQKVGFALKDLSKFHQVIAITHLPQIAGLANHHYLIQKIQQDSRVISSIKKLQDKERITEVAKLLSGEKVTESSIESAKELVRLKE